MRKPPTPEQRRRWAATWRKNRRQVYLEGRRLQYKLRADRDVEFMDKRRDAGREYMRAKRARAREST